MAYQLNTPNILNVVNTTNPSSVFDYLRPNAFRFVIKDLPKVAYTCQSANLPGLQLGFALQPTPFIDLPRIGDKLQYDEFTIRFLIAEDMSNYVELLEWIVALGFPESYNNYSKFVGERLNRFPFVKINNGTFETLAYSDGTLTILDSANTPKTNIILKDMFPISVQALDYDITSSSVDFLVGIASFKYRTFDIQPL
jgi:hypothetical protein